MASPPAHPPSWSLHPADLLRHQPHKPPQNRPKAKPFRPPRNQPTDCCLISDSDEEERNCLQQSSALVNPYRTNRKQNELKGLVKDMIEISDDDDEDCKNRQEAFGKTTAKSNQDLSTTNEGSIQQTSLRKRKPPQTNQGFVKPKAARSQALSEGEFRSYLDAAKRKILGGHGDEDGGTDEELFGTPKPAQRQETSPRSLTQGSQSQENTPERPRSKPDTRSFIQPLRPPTSQTDPKPSHPGRESHFSGNFNKSQPEKYREAISNIRTSGGSSNRLSMVLPKGGKALTGTLAQRFEDCGLIGEGKSCFIRKVRSKKDGKIYVLKSCKVATEHSVAYINREYKMLERLEHPSVIKVYAEIESGKNVNFIDQVSPSSSVF